MYSIYLHNNKAVPALYRITREGSSFFAEERALAFTLAQVPKDKTPEEAGIIVEALDDPPEALMEAIGDRTFEDSQSLMLFLKAWENGEILPDPAKTEKAQRFMVAKALGIVLDMPILEQAALTAEAARGLPVAEAIDGTEWIPGISVNSGLFIQYCGKVYKCVQAHLTQSDWAPDIAAALWVELRNDNTAWVRPTGAHDAYSIGDIVIYNEKKYECLIDANTWSPEEYPAGWRLIL